MVVPVLLGGDQSIHAVRYQEKTFADPEGLTAVAARVLAMKSVDSFMYSSHLEKASIWGSICQWCALSSSKILGALWIGRKSTMFDHPRSSQRRDSCPVRPILETVRIPSDRHDLVPWIQLVQIMARGWRGLGPGLSQSVNRGRKQRSDGKSRCNPHLGNEIPR